MVESLNRKQSAKPFAIELNLFPGSRNTAMLKKSSVRTLLVLLYLSIVPSFALSAPPIEIHFIDVGQGDAILVKGTEKQNILVDAGNFASGHLLKGYLVEQNISSLKAFVVTHVHPDHIGGAFYILPQMDVKTVYDNGYKFKRSTLWRQYHKIVTDLRIEREELQHGDELSLPNLQMKVLSPIPPLSGNLNDDSIVIKLNYGNISILLAGDLTTKGEGKLLKSGVDLKSQILKIGHHGACDATSDEFLDNVNPKIAIIQVGRNNYYGSPCSEIVNKLSSRNIETFRTDHDGSVVFKTDGQKYTIDKNITR